MFAIVCVVDQPEQLNAVLDSWKRNGFHGVTIFESTGLHRLLNHPHIPMRYGFASAGAERGNYTLFTVVEGLSQVEACLHITEAITGDFDSPNTGIFVAWPLAFAKGVLNDFGVQDDMG